MSRHESLISLVSSRRAKGRKLTTRAMTREELLACGTHKLDSRGHMIRARLSDNLTQSSRPILSMQGERDARTHDRRPQGKYPEQDEFGLDEGSQYHTAGMSPPPRKTRICGHTTHIHGCTPCSVSIRCATCERERGVGGQ